MVEIVTARCARLAMTATSGKLRIRHLEAYCVKCKTKREMQNPQPEFSKAGSPGPRGPCPVCGTTLFRMGGTPAHAGLTPPAKPTPEERGDARRSGKLVIVESPAKARTVGRFLGKGYRVEASVGHVRDLLRSQLSVDVENDFAPRYRVPNEKRPVVKALKKEALAAEHIYLATEEAFNHPRSINMDLVAPQQPRRVLDRLVGYSLSPILWTKVRNRLSAGRVQSVALRLIVEREREIEAFIPVEYWDIHAELQPEGSASTFIAKLVEADGAEPKLGTREDVDPLLADMQSAAYTITEIKRGQRRRKAPAPFTTSTLQQEASRKLGFTAKRTMAVAQQLYEGIDLGEDELTGLITYMRTDSTNISPIAQQEARDYIKEVHGDSYLPEEAPVYKTRAKGAQEAHEAIRPTSARRTPSQLKDHISRDQYRLYQLIWQRFLGSQMNPAVYDTISVHVTGDAPIHKYGLRASGSNLVF